MAGSKMALSKEHKRKSLVGTASPTRQVGHASAEVTAGFTWLRGCQEGSLQLRHAQSA